jgi:hypothetical protein
MTGSLETQREAIDRLRNEGYGVDLWIAEDGTITSGTGDWGAGQIVVREIVRFEGESNPDDEGMVVAVDITDGPSGLLSLPYGPDLSGPQAQTVRDLEIHRAKGPGRPSSPG